MHVLEDLSREVVEEDFRRWQPRARGSPLGAGLLEPQHETGDPAVDRFVERADRLPGPSPAGQRPDQPRHLGRREPELGPVEDVDHPPGAVTSKGGRRLAAADDDDASTMGNLGQGLPDDLLQRGVARHVLVVVEDHREGRLESLVELAEEAPGEDAESGPVLRRQERERAPPLGGGVTQVVEEGRDVTIAAVHLVPEGRPPARRQVARDECRLAGSRRSPHPGDRPLAARDPAGGRAAAAPPWPPGSGEWSWRAPLKPTSILRRAGPPRRRRALRTPDVQVPAAAHRPGRL